MITSSFDGPRGPAPQVAPRRTQATFATSTFDDLPVAVLHFVGSSMVAANAEWAAISRLGDAESIGDGWLTAVHPDDRANAAEFVATRAQADGELSLRIVPSDGPATWFRGHRTVASVLAVPGAPG